MTPRGVLASVGIAAAGVGFLLVARPSLAVGLGVPRLALLLVGALGAVEGVRSALERRRVDLQQATLPEPEEHPGTPIPGDDVDERIGSLVAPWRGRRGHEEYERLRDRLRDAAVETVVARTGISRGAARERVAAGEWTDDPAAAAFLGDSGVPDPPLRVRIRAALAPGSRVRFYAARTADAIVDRREEA